MPSITNITNRTFKDVGRTEQELILTTAGQVAACVGLSLTNTTGRVVIANVYITDDNGNKVNYVKDLRICPKASARVINGGEKLLLPADNAVSVVSDTSKSLDVVFSLVTITTT